MSAWSEFPGSLEIKEILPVPLIVVYGHLVWHSQWAVAKWGNPGICAHAEVHSIMEQVRHVFIISPMLLDFFMWKITSHGKIYIGINLWTACD